MKIMIVDDHRGIREMLRSLLASPGIELSECADGREALAEYRNFRPDWVFMDSAMKEVDGLAATRQILSLFPDARILMVSEENIEQMRRAATIAGARGFVTKDHLLESLRQNQGLSCVELENLWAVPAGWSE